MNISSYDAIWFDVFGTLIENNEAKKYGREIISILKKQVWDLSSYQLMERDYWKNPDKYFSIFNLQDSVKNELISLFYKEKKSYKLKPYTKELIGFLKGQNKKVFLISNLSSLYVSIVEELLWNFDFDLKVYSCYVWMKKNIQNPEIFKQTLEFLRIKPDKVIFTWDNIKNDVQAPSKIWINSILIGDFVNNILNK